MPPNATSPPGPPPPASAPRSAHVGRGPDGASRCSPRPRATCPRGAPASTAIGRWTRARRSRSACSWSLDDVEADTPPLWVKARVIWARPGEGDATRGGRPLRGDHRRAARLAARSAARDQPPERALTDASRAIIRREDRRDARAVERGADDAARVAGALAARIETRASAATERRPGRAARAPASWCATRRRPARALGEQKPGSRAPHARAAPRAAPRATKGGKHLARGRPAASPGR